MLRQKTKTARTRSRSYQYALQSRFFQVCSTGSVLFTVLSSLPLVIPNVIETICCSTWSFRRCDVCSKTFTTRQLLIGHKLQHRLTKNKPYECDYCKKSFRSKGAITHHLFSNHVNAEPKFECKICRKKFQLESLLRTHTYAVHRQKKTRWPFIAIHKFFSIEYSFSYCGIIGSFCR